MILSFKTSWPKKMDHLAGSPTYFVEKIWWSLDDLNDPIIPVEIVNEYHEKGGLIDRSNYNYTYGLSYAPKIHTIREDPHDRWKPGAKIHPAIFVRTKNHFQFAPTLECKSVQEIIITYKKDGGVEVYVGGRELNWLEIGILSVNDGFNNQYDFFRWFNKDFTGKIINWTNSIHWTDKTY